MESSSYKINSDLLGIATDEIAGLGVEEIVGNEASVKMLLHYYRKLNYENERLENDLNTYKSYQKSYESKKKNANIGAILLACSNIGIGFGINLLTSNDIAPGIFTILPGIALLIAGLYLSTTERV